MSSFLKRKQVFFALKNVSFDVRAGEALGIVGPNGSGKTTLIKLLSSITAPTRGEILMRGRLASLVEVGAGFHPDLTGRENIYLNGSILGMNNREITSKIDDIVEFSGLGAFLGVPVKRYSSGMFVRLGFSIAAHLDAEILLLDEVLAMGDVAFQTRCLDRIDEVRKAGRTIVLVSHDLAAIERICDRALLLRSGEIVEMGDPKMVIEAHQTLAYGSLPRGSLTGSPAGPVMLKELTFFCPDGGRPRTGAPLICRLAYEAKEAVSDVSCTLSFIWPSGHLCTQLTSEQVQVQPGINRLEFEVPTLTMQRGLYSVDVAIEQLGGRMLEQRSRCSLLRVDQGRIIAGDFYMPHTCLVRQWSCQVEAGQTCAVRGDR